MTAVVINGTDAERMWSTHDASVSTQDGRKKKATIREVYQVVTEAGDGVVEVLAATDLPVINQLYPTTVQIRCKQRNPRQVGPVFWHVDIVWEGEFGPGGAADSPLNDPPEITWGKVESDEAIDEDWDGNAIVTPNGEPLEGVTMKVSDIMLTVKRNYAIVNIAATHQYLHSVNSDTFAGFSAGTGRLTQFSAKEVVAKEVSPGGGYWEVTAGVQFRYPYRTTPARAWYARLRLEGYYIRTADGIKIAHDCNKQDVTRPVLLDAQGYRLYDPCNMPLNPTALWQEYKRYQPLPYNSLGLL